MTNFQNSFLNGNPESRSVQSNWTMFKDEINELMEKYIQSKISRANHSNPWITKEVTRIIKKKQRMYNKAWITNDHKDWLNYKEFQKKTQKKQRQNY